MQSQDACPLSDPQLLAVQLATHRRQTRNNPMSSWDAGAQSIFDFPDRGGDSKSSSFLWLALNCERVSVTNGGEFPSSGAFIKANKVASTTLIHRLLSLPLPSDRSA